MQRPACARRGHASAYSDWDGVFFKGEASLKYTVITPPNNLTEGCVSEQRFPPDDVDEEVSSLSPESLDPL
jgi:hypothetical protein